MFQVAYRTDVGLKRSNNQDSIKVCKDIGLFIVADGMGGYKGGEIASLLAVETIENIFKSEHDYETVKSLIEHAVLNANKEIYLKACDETELRGMGTTCSLVVIEDELIHIGHVGDSRIYFVFNDEIHQITLDHTLVENLVARGEVKREDVKTHPKRNVITRAVGSDPEVVVDYAVHSIKNANKIILCSDGLTGKIDDQEILEIVNTNSITHAVDALIKLANDRGGSDNISVVIVEIAD